MTTKTLQRTVNIDTKESGNWVSFTLSYYLTASELVAVDDRLSVLIYGIELVKTEKDKSGEIIKEREVVEDLSLCVNRVNRMINILATHTVTPVSLKDVVSDLLVEEKFCGLCDDEISSGISMIA